MPICGVLDLILLRKRLLEPSILKPRSYDPLHLRHIGFVKNSGFSDPSKPPYTAI